MCPEKHRYLQDKYYTSKFDDDTMKLAYAHYILQADDLKVPKENKNLVIEVLEENDEIYSTAPARRSGAESPAPKRACRAAKGRWRDEAVDKQMSDYVTVSAVAPFIGPVRMPE